VQNFSDVFVQCNYEVIGSKDFNKMTHDAMLEKISQVTLAAFQGFELPTNPLF
jgi:adenylylsulfate kinase-like enzyme